jgi:hypothetical protein
MEIEILYNIYTKTLLNMAVGSLEQSYATHTLNILSFVIYIVNGGVSDNSNTLFIKKKNDTIII